MLANEQIIEREVGKQEIVCIMNPKQCGHHIRLWIHPKTCLIWTETEASKLPFAINKAFQKNKNTVSTVGCWHHLNIIGFIL